MSKQAGKQETFQATDDHGQVEVTIGIHEDGETGWFEMSDDEDLYLEGGLWFENNELIDYDGVFVIPTAVLDKLEEWGYDVEEHR